MATPFAEAAYKAATEAKDAARRAVDQAEAQIVVTHTAYLKALYEYQQAQKRWNQLNNSQGAGAPVSDWQIDAAVNEVNWTQNAMDAAEDKWFNAKEAKRVANDKASEAFANWRQAAKLLEN